MTTWTHDRIKLLATLKHEGWSCGQIAEKMGVSRNAISGKLDRLGQQIRDFIMAGSGLARPPRSYQQQRRKTTTIKTAPHRPILRPIEEVEPVVPAVEEADPVGPPVVAGRVTLFDLTPRSCKWPTNDGHPQFYFCGEPRIDGSPYCRAHDVAAYGPTHRRNR